MEHDSQEFANVLNAAMAGVPTDLEIGASFDATEAINNLMALGYTAEEAAAIMKKMGFSVTYTTETHHIGDITGTDYGVSAPGATVDNESTTATSVVVASATKNDSAGTGFSGGGGGGGGGGGDKWENPYDKLHNVLEEINDLLREREKLERRYQRLVS
jgi:Holliday junction resolvasome RuvABC DNA-binding subunit